MPYSYGEKVEITSHERIKKRFVADFPVKERCPIQTERLILLAHFANQKIAQVIFYILLGIHIILGEK